MKANLAITAVSVLALHAQSAYVAAADNAGSGAPRLISCKKIWNHGGHNAFTDLIRFQNQWLCTFREAEGHVRVLPAANPERAAGQ